jgi:hypothetical protein
VPTLQPTLIPTPVATPTPMPTPVPTPQPTATPTPTPAPIPVTHLEGRVYNSLLSGQDAAKPLTVHLKHKKGSDFINIPTTARTDASGRYIFHAVLEPGTYQVVFRNPEQLPNTVGVAVSDAVDIALDRPVQVDMDVAWDDAAFDQKLDGMVQSMTWGKKPSYPQAVYQGILRENPDDSRTDLLPFPSAPTVGTKGSFVVSSQTRGRKLFYFIKYWKQGGEFNGAGYYGQSKPHVLQLPTQTGGTKQ